jgi:hypothetical protein
MHHQHKTRAEQKKIQFYLNEDEKNNLFNI